MGFIGKIANYQTVPSAAPSFAHPSTRAAAVFGFFLMGYGVAALVSAFSVRPRGRLMSVYARLLLAAFAAFLGYYWHEASWGAGPPEFVAKLWLLTMGHTMLAGVGLAGWGEQYVLRRDARRAGSESGGAK